VAGRWRVLILWLGRDHRRFRSGGVSCSKQVFQGIRVGGPKGKFGGRIQALAGLDRLLERKKNQQALIKALEADLAGESGAVLQDGGHAVAAAGGTVVGGS